MEAAVLFPRRSTCYLETINSLAFTDTFGEWFSLFRSDDDD